MTSTLVTERRRNDSDLSDAHEDPSDRPSPASSDHHVDVSNQAHDDEDIQDSDVSDADNASDDGDFDMQLSPASQHEDVAEDGASSPDSSRGSKRKAPIDDDQYIKANPELYGLRRSVWL